MTAKRYDSSELAQELGLDSTPYCQKDGKVLFDETVTVLDRHFHFELPCESRLIALFIMQGHVAIGLPGVFYVAIPGGKGCGKTNLLDIIRVLTNGKRFENISIPALARSVKHGMTICLDEFDVERGKDYDEVRNALVRQGYKNDGSKYVRWDANRKEPEEISVYGPKAVAFIGKIDPPLLDRSYIVPVEKYKGENGYEFTRLGIWKDMGDLSTRLREWGNNARDTYTPEKLMAIAQTPEFIEKVKKTTESFGASRGTELAIYANLVAHMAGIDVAADVAQSDKRRSTEDDSADDQLEVLDALESILKNPQNQKTLESVKEIRIPQKEVRNIVNEGRKARNERPMSHSMFKIMRRDIGIRNSWIREEHHRIIWAIPVSALASLLSPLAHLSPQNENPDQQTLEGSKVSKVSTMWEEFKRGTPYPELVEKYGAELLEREKVPKIGGRPE